MKHFQNLALCLTAIAVLVGCSSVTAVKPSSAAAPLTSNKVLVLEPQLLIFEIGLSQVPERRPDLEKAARKTATETVAQLATASKRYTVATNPQLSEAEQYELEQRAALFYSNVMAYTDMKKVGGSGWTQVESSFKGTIGKSALLQGIAGRTGAHYALLIAGSDSYTTGAAKAAGIVAAITSLGNSSLAVAGGAYLVVGVADLNTGNILWYAHDTTKSDLTDPDALRRLIKSLLEKSPWAVT